MSDRVKYCEISFEFARFQSVQAEKIADDFVALLDNPGPTSDLTLTAAGGRSFRVHRLVLAARCEFFKSAFSIGIGDAASAPELQLANADPDALALLLRFIYGGILDDCERDLLKPAVELADFLRLVDACEELRRRLLLTVTKDTIAEDLLWAEGRGYEDTLTALVDKYVSKLAATGADAIADALAERSPKLLARLHKQYVRVRENYMPPASGSASSALGAPTTPFGPNRPGFGLFKS